MWAEAIGDMLGPEAGTGIRGNLGRACHSVTEFSTGGEGGILKLSFARERSLLATKDPPKEVRQAGRPRPLLRESGVSGEVLS